MEVLEAELPAPDDQPAEIKFQFAEAFGPLLQPCRFKGAKGGRGAAKSHFFAGNLVKDCYTNPGTRAIGLREIQKDLRQSSKLLIQDKIVAMGLQSWFNILDNEIQTPGDGVISFQGMQNHTADSIKSLEGYRRGWFEEAHRMSQRSLDLLYPTFRMEDSELWFSWNPISKKDPVEKFFRENAGDPDFACIEVDYSDNPWLTDALRRDMERDRRRDPEKYKHIWLGDYQTHSEARVFHNWKVEDFDSPETAEDWEQLQVDLGVTLKPSECRFYFGCDWGFGRDNPTVLVRMFLIRALRRVYIDYEAWAIGCEIDRCPRLFMEVPQSQRWPITADSANPQNISYMRRHGFPRMKASVKGPGSVEEGVEFLKAWDIIVHPRCRHVIDELSFYSYEVDPKTEEVLPILADKKNHTIDSARYALEDERRPGVRAGAGRY